MGEKHPETAGKTRSPVSASATQGCSRHLSGAGGGIRGLDVLPFPGPMWTHGLPRQRLDRLGEPATLPWSDAKSLPS